MENKRLNESIISIRVKLQNAKLKKSGKNKFAGFEYFELADFLPKLNELMLEEGLNDRFYIKDNLAYLEIQKGDETNTYSMPFVMFNTPLNKNGQPSMQDIQYLGALNTYYKRYLYLNAFGITDGEVIDSMNNSDLTTIDYKAELENYIKNNGLNKVEVCKEYKLNAKSTNDDFKLVLNELQSAAEASIGERLGQ